MPNLENAKVFKTDYAGRELVVEIGKYAEQANGACLVRCGDTVVNVTVWMSGAKMTGAVSGLVFHSDSDPLAYLFALELGDTLHDVHHEPAHRRGGIEFVLHRVEFLALVAEFVHHQGEVHTVPVYTVHLQDEDEIPSFHVRHHTVVFGAVRVTS